MIRPLLVPIVTAAALLSVPLAGTPTAAQSSASSPARRQAPAAARPPAQAPAPPAPFPATPPAPGTPKDFHVPEAKRFTLANGLEVALVQWGTTPKVTLSLTVRSGNA